MDVCLHSNGEKDSITEQEALDNPLGTFYCSQGSMVKIIIQSFDTHEIIVHL